MVSQFKIGHCCHIIRQGGVIAYPTETVFGLGCDPFNETAVQRLLEIKHRTAEKGLIIIGSQIKQLSPLLNKLTEQQYQQISQLPDHPTTWIAPKSKNTPDWLTGKHTTIAIRLTTQPIVKALCEKLEHALVSTSANISGFPVAQSALDIYRYFGQKIDGIIYENNHCLGSPSEIRHVLSGEILRRYSPAGE